MKAVILTLLLLLPGLGAASIRHHVLIVSGIGGLDEYQQQFLRNSTRLYEAALEAGLDQDRIILLSAAPEEATSGRYQLSSKENIARALEQIRASAGPQDRVFVFLFGHGNPRGDSAVFNLPGPDISADELGRMLDDFEQQSLIVVNTASASGPFANRLSADNRIIITATSSGREYYAVLFGEYFAAAFVDAGADRDKDEKVSLLEAFDYARREVRRSYDSEGRLLTEHALLDDNGDGVASLDPGEFEADGAVANRIHLQPPLTPTGPEASELAGMVQRKQELEQSIRELKMRRDSLEKNSYYDQLEVLLVDLALLSREIRELAE